LMLVPTLFDACLERTTTNMEIMKVTTIMARTIRGDRVPVPQKPI
jgi:hypothetical protein